MSNWFVPQNRVTPSLPSTTRAFPFPPCSSSSSLSLRFAEDARLEVERNDHQDRRRVSNVLLRLMTSFLPLNCFRIVAQAGVNSPP